MRKTGLQRTAREWPGTALGAIGLVLAALTLNGCASRDKIAQDEVSDPFEPVNRAFFKFNDTADRYVLRPVAKGYRNGLPPQLQNGIRNIFNNLEEPITIVSDLLQAKWAQSAQDTARFVLNSTVGLFGLFDPASEIGLEQHDEDFGQAFRMWGIPQGPYLMVPIFGPYTLGHGVGAIAQGPVSPYVSRNTPWLGLGLWAVESVDDRSRLLDADQEYRDSFDPYLFIRDAYWQNRQYKILDGDVPEYDPALDDPALEDESLDGAG